MATSDYVAVGDFTLERGWSNPAEGEHRARWCCEQLEAGRILLFERIPFDLPRSAKEFLCSACAARSPFHKNISYRPETDVLRGFRGRGDDEFRVHDILRHYSQFSTDFLGGLLSPYARHWRLDYASFRPNAEPARSRARRHRDDLLHIDAFPTRPTGGDRILRCFVNVNPTAARTWRVGESFPELVRKHARAAGLDHVAAGHKGGAEKLGFVLKQVLGVGQEPKTPYDRFMLRFHNYLKANAALQNGSDQRIVEFPPGSCWICFTDALPHAVLRGQFALEQTFLVPVSALLAPETSPLRVLEALANRALIPAAKEAPLPPYGLPGHPQPQLSAR